MGSQSGGRPAISPKRKRHHTKGCLVPFAVFVGSALALSLVMLRDLIA